MTSEREILVGFNHDIPLSLRDAYNEKTGPRRRGKVLIDLLESYVNDKNYDAYSGARNAAIPLDDTGLLGVVPNYRTHDYGDMITNAKRLHLVIDDISFFLKCHQHFTNIMQRLLTDDVITDIIITSPTPESTDILRVFEKALKERAASLLHLHTYEPSGRTTFVYSSLETLPSFALVADDIAISTLMPRGSLSIPSFAFKWAEISTDLNQPSVYNSLLISIVRSLIGSKIED